MVRALSYMHTFYEWERKMKEIEELKTALNVHRVETNERLKKLETPDTLVDMRLDQHEDWIKGMDERVTKLESPKYEPLPTPLDIKWDPCHNFQAGRYKDVDTIVYHYTAGTSNAEGIISWWNTLKSPKRVSAHYIIDRNGDVTQCVDEDDTAWHAWKWNPESIGIEICAEPAGVTRTGGIGQKMTSEQEESLAALTKDIMTRHEITRITGHRFLGMDTSCPGQVFPNEQRIEEFLDKWEIMV